MNIDDIVAELLAGPLDEFTNARNAKAKELKGVGQRELAVEIAGIKKPPVSVWAANQLYRRDKPLLERLRRAGQGVVQAQSGAVSGRKNAAPELRSASEALQRELEAALREARDVLRADQHAAEEATLRRVQEMLRLAAVSGSETWSRLQRGALISEPRAGEDMLTAAFALGSTGGSSTAAPRARENDSRATRTAARAAAETEKRIEMEHVVRTARADDEAAQQAAQTAHRLREEADRVAGEAKRAGEKARQAEKELERANARAKVSREAARRISRRG